MARVKRKHIDKSVVVAARTLRELMYKPGKGTWFSMTLGITPAGDGWEASFNYTEKPVWELGDPVNDLCPGAVPLPPATRNTSPTGSRKH